MDVNDGIELSYSQRQPETFQTAHAPKPRHWFRAYAKLLSFLACVLLPALAAGAYEFGMASDQYVSAFKFVVKEQAPQSSQPNSVMSALGGGNPMLAIMEDSEVVVEYIQSSQILSDLRDTVSLNRVFATQQADWVSRMRAGLPIEKQLRYWKHKVQPSFDMSSGVVTVTVHAFNPADTQMLANAVLASSEALVNRMSLSARQASLNYAEQSANTAQQDLLADETRLAAYRNKYSVLFPEMSATSITSVGTNLNTQLAQDQASLASLFEMGQTGASPQVQTLQARIAATQAELSKVSAALATGGGDATMATVLSGYDTLMETEKLDEEMYSSDLIALQDARNAASEKSMYLEAFVQPNLPESSIYPDRGLITAETAFAGFIFWVLLILMVNIVRDQVD